LKEKMRIGGWPIFAGITVILTVIWATARIILLPLNDLALETLLGGGALLFVAALLGPVLSAFKWQKLISISTGLNLSLMSSLRCSAVGSMVNNFIPTTLAGDLVKAQLYGNATGEKTACMAILLFTKIVDLCVGIAAVLLSIAVTTDLFIKEIKDWPSRLGVWILIIGLCSGALMIFLRRTGFVRKITTEAARTAGAFKKINRNKHAWTVGISLTLSAALVKLILPWTVVAITSNTLPSFTVVAIAPVLEAASIIPASFMGMIVRDGGWFFVLLALGYPGNVAVASVTLLVALSIFRLAVLAFFAATHRQIHWKLSKGKDGT